MVARLSAAERDAAAQVVALLSVLVHAWQTNDFHEAARTRDALAQLGVTVQLPRRRAAEKDGTDG